MVVSVWFTVIIFFFPCFATKRMTATTVIYFSLICYKEDNSNYRHLFLFLGLLRRGQQHCCHRLYFFLNFAMKRMMTLLSLNFFSSVCYEKDNDSNVVVFFFPWFVTKKTMVIDVVFFFLALLRRRKQ